MITHLYKIFLYSLCIVINFLIYYYYIIYLFIILYYNYNCNNKYKINISYLMWKTWSQNKKKKIKKSDCDEGKALRGKISRHDLVLLSVLPSLNRHRTSTKPDSSKPYNHQVKPEQLHRDCAIERFLLSILTTLVHSPSRSRLFPCGE